MLELTKYEYLKLYFQIYSLQPGVKKLTPNEVKTICHLVLNEKVNPYYGEGRDAILAKLKIASPTYSTCLKGLSKKGLLLKTQEDNGYALHPNLIKLKEKVIGSEELPILYWYKIK